MLKEKSMRAEFYFEQLQRRHRYSKQVFKG